jgi:hypothetical protein
MNKILTSIIFSVFLITSASAEIGVNVGVSGQLGIAAATGTESQVNNAGEVTPTVSKESEIGALGFASIFIEKTLGDRFAVGIDYVPSSLDSEQTTETLTDVTGTTASATVTNTMKIAFEDLTTYYAAFNVTDSLYVKAGVATVDIITKENLGTGGAYGNTDTDAMVLGFGWNKTFDNTMFVRLESLYMNFDSASVTSGDNTVSLTKLDTMTGKLSVGKSF